MALFNLTPEELQEVKALVVETASPDTSKRSDAMNRLISQVESPIRMGFFQGDTVGSIYTREDLDPSAQAIYGLDFVGPSGEDQYLAYFIPDQGYIPERRVISGEITVDTFEIGNSIDWDLKFARTARWNIVARALEVFRKGFTMKVNDEGWRNIIGAGLNRLDDQIVASGNAFSLGQISLMQLRMERGVDFSEAFLTDLYVSPEVARDIRNFAVDTSIDFLSRHDIFFNPTDIGRGTGDDQVIATIYGTRIHKNNRFGIGKTYNTTFNTLNNLRTTAYTFALASDEFITGLDLSADGKQAFMMPVRRDLAMFEDQNLNRRRKAGVYGEMELGFAVMDNRRILHGTIDR